MGEWGDRDFFDHAMFHAPMGYPHILSSKSVIIFSTVKSFYVDNIQYYRVDAERECAGCRYLFNNQLQGTIPDRISTMVKLEGL